MDTTGRPDSPCWVFGPTEMIGGAMVFCIPWIKRYVEKRNESIEMNASPQTDKLMERKDEQVTNINEIDVKTKLDDEHIGSKEDGTIPLMDGHIESPKDGEKKVNGSAPQIDIKMENETTPEVKVDNTEGSENTSKC